MSSNLSLASKKYDVEKKGYLSKEQQVLRDLDKDGKGCLTPAELAPLMEEYKKIHQDNAKNRRLIILLFIAVILLGVGTIVASVLAVNASKDTAISPEGVLTSKNTDEAVITTSQGFSVATREVIDPSTGAPIHCIRFSSISDIYVSFSMGVNVLLHLNNTLSTGNDASAGKYSFPVMKIRGDMASYNDTSVNVGNIVFDVSPRNACNVGFDAEVDDGDVRKLFQRHLEMSQQRRRMWNKFNMPPCSVVDSCSIREYEGHFVCPTCVD